VSDKEAIRRRWQDTPMLTPQIRKVTVNISVGKSGEPLEKAARVLEQLTDRKPVKRRAKKTIREFGIRKGEPISCVVTLRKDKTIEFLTQVLQAVDNKISKDHFDAEGNFSFGIKEHIEIPGTKYVPELGIFGMDISVALGRAGYRVKERRRAKSKIGKRHLLTPEEAMVFLEDTLEAEVV
jgi:large subunit ribosomal protein L5